MEAQATYDIIVVGGRIVGASTAGLLAKQGFSVLLLEKASFPSPTISCPVVFGNALEILSRFGAEDVVDRLGAPKLRLYGTNYGFARVVGHLPAYQGRDYAYSIRRERLDEAVARHVATLPGVTFQEGFSVEELIWEAGRVVGVRGRLHGAAPTELRARYAVVGADGRNSPIARMVKAREYDLKPEQGYIYYAYYRNVRPLDEPSAMMYRGLPGSSVLVFDADDDLAVLSIGGTTPSFEEARKDPEGVMLNVMRRIPELADRIAHAERVTPVKGLAPTGQFRRQPYGPGWALAGDAGQRFDPVTGQGIAQGLHAAELLVEALTQVRAGRAWDVAMREFQRRRDRDTKGAYEFAALQAQLKPSNWLSRRLIKHMEADPEVCRFYFGTSNGVTSADENFNLWRALKLAFTPLPRRRLTPSAG
jgi:flavin-dependent dehydrogenase